MRWLVCLMALSTIGLGLGGGAAFADSRCLDDRDERILDCIDQVGCDAVDVPCLQRCAGADPASGLCTGPVISRLVSCVAGCGSDRCISRCGDAEVAGLAACAHGS